jgi:hypothetical protein
MLSIAFIQFLDIPDYTPLGGWEVFTDVTLGHSSFYAVVEEDCGCVVVNEWFGLE